MLMALLVGTAALHAQNVTRETVPGVTNFARVETTIACAGATTPAAMAELKKIGYASVINLRLATEPGAEIDAERAAARAAGLNFVHLPFDASAPDPMLVTNFLNEITAPKNQPAFVHCASGNRAAALWMIKRVMVDRWDVDRAQTEATALGMSSAAMKAFVKNYLDAHRQ
jgi:uncharacterized protein (TIGR01244 family)